MDTDYLYLCFPIPSYMFSFGILAVHSVHRFLSVLSPYRSLIHSCSAPFRCHLGISCAPLSYRTIPSYFILFMYPSLVLVFRFSLGVLSDLPSVGQLCSFILGMHIWRA